PKYYSHFSISMIENGRTNLLNFEEGQVDMGGGTNWKNTFKDGVKLDVGTYLLTTGMRLANGSVLVNNQIFNIRQGETTTLDLKMQTADNEVAIIGNFDSESKFIQNGTEVSILSQTGRGYFVLGILGVGQEPTNHALNDIAKVKKELDEWGRPFVLLFESEADARKFNLKEFGELPKNTIFGIDSNGSIKKQIASQMKLSNDRLLPIFIIGDTFNRVVFSSQGYTIGLGEQLQKVIHKL
ncbi:MAG: transglutaminase domain-containing protein, partial [Prevotella sp.]